jgi:putative addiction module component (TIGR02574 family)
MSQGISQLLEQAMRLPDQERGDLAARLIDSLDPSTGDDEVEMAWDEEIQGRLADLDEGRVQRVPWPEARRLITEESPIDASDTVV